MIQKQQQYHHLSPSYDQQQRYHHCHDKSRGRSGKPRDCTQDKHCPLLTDDFHKYLPYVDWSHQVHQWRQCTPENVLHSMVFDPFNRLCPTIIWKQWLQQQYTPLQQQYDEAYRQGMFALPAPHLYLLTASLLTFKFMSDGGSDAWTGSFGFLRGLLHYLIRHAPSQKTIRLFDLEADLARSWNWRFFIPVLHATDMIKQHEAKYNALTPR